MTNKFFRFALSIDFFSPDRTVNKQALMENTIWINKPIMYDAAYDLKMCLSLNLKICCSLEYIRKNIIIFLM